MRVSAEKAIVITLTIEDAERLSSELGAVLVGAVSFHDSLSALEDGIDDALEEANQ